MSRKSDNPKFLEYKEFIVKHQNFAGFPYQRKNDGEVKWVATGKSKMGQKRTAWWDEKRKELGIPKETGWISTTARKNHPTKEKPCSVCGRVMSLEYVYLNKPVAEKLNNYDKLHEEYSKLSDIRDVVPDVIAELDEKGFEFLADIFNVPDNVPQSIDSYIDFIIEYAKEKRAKCGPGAMSNAPDRLDGFHTYNRCCRKKEDTGRHDENLRRYSQDRRAYEFWADGNWKAADRLMAEYNKHGLSADHIGPISLGFCHDPVNFQPMTVSEQATKNNRMEIEDVKKLISIEKEGNQVVSWHSKHIWDELKCEAEDSLESKILSKYMRKNMHFVLSTFARLYVEGYRDFLEYLLEPNLEYSYYDYKYEGFNPKTGEYENQIKRQLDTKNQKNNAQRYLRIAFESLEKYMDKENRKISNEDIFQHTEHLFKKIAEEIKNNNYEKAHELLNKMFYKQALHLKKQFLRDIKNRKY